ncbi:MAG: leucine-rich repeat protein [Clostridia bacterium]|nr:leucine-rich repeat protein [Clostridia bacterium]
MKKTLSLLLALTVLLCTVPFIIASADDYGSFTYTVTDDGAAITKLDQGVTGSVIIPSVIDNYPVTEIGDSAFSNCSLVTGLTVPASVVKIGSGAFLGLTGLQRFEYSGSFAQWSSIYFKDEGSVPFSKTDSVYIGGKVPGQISAQDWQGITEISGYAFYNCDTLTSVEFPESLYKIGTNSFYGCDGITSIVIPKNVGVVTLGAFTAASNLESLSVEPGNQAYHAAGNCLIETNQKILIFGIKTSVIPDDGSVEQISYRAFSWCSGLKSIDIPEGVRAISSFALIGSTPITFGAFSDCADLERVHLPSTLTTIGSGAFYNCKKLSEINIPDSVKTIENSAFMKCSSLTQATIPEGVTTIGRFAFRDCSALETLDFNAVNVSSFKPGTVMSLKPSGTFADWLAGCTSLTDLVIGENVEIIPEKAFYNINSIRTITLHNSVQIGKDAFKKCDKFSRINFYGTPEEWALNYNTSFTSTAYIHDIYYLGGLCTKTDDASNVTVQYIYGTFGTPNDGDLSLNVEDIEENDARFSAFKAYIDGAQVALYEIHMKNADNENVQPLDENKVTVKIPLPYAIDPAKYDTVFIHHRKQDGKTERIKFSTGDLAIEDGFFIFEIDSFSDFAVCVDDGGNHVDENGDYICDLCRESLTYTVKLIVDGVNLGNVVYHYGDTEIENLPDVPGKEGYTGKWEYTITGSELDIRPVYKAITYYASFIADGREIAKIPFTVEDKSINEPAVPEKDGYTGSWSEYTLAASDMTVNAVYTETEEPENPVNPATPDTPATQTGPDTPDKPAMQTEPDKPDTPDEPATQTEPGKPDTPDNPATQTELGKPDTPDNPQVPGISIRNYRETLPVDYKSKLVFRITSTSKISDEYKIIWSTGDEGTTCTIDKATEKEYKISAKLIKKSDNSTVAVTKEETVTVNTGFFAKIIAFFRSLFHTLPMYEDNLKK